MKRILESEIIRYLIAGSTAALSLFLVLFILKELVGLNYLLSSTLAYPVSFFVSFLLQKFWVFDDKRREVLNRQLTSFFVLAMLNLLLNDFLMFLFVEKFDIWYITAQFLSAGIVATWSFTLYKYKIFI